MHNPRLQPLLAVVIVAVLAAACSGETAVEGEPGQGEGDVEVELDTARGRREAPAVATSSPSAASSSTAIDAAPSLTTDEAVDDSTTSTPGSASDTTASPDSVVTTTLADPASEACDERLGVEADDTQWWLAGPNGEQLSSPAPLGELAVPTLERLQLDLDEVTEALVLVPLSSDAVLVHFYDQDGCVWAEPTGVVSGLPVRPVVGTTDTAIGGVRCDGLDVVVFEATPILPGRPDPDGADPDVADDEPPAPTGYEGEVRLISLFSGAWEVSIPTPTVLSVAEAQDQSGFRCDQ